MRHHGLDERGVEGCRVVYKWDRGKVLGVLRYREDETRHYIIRFRLGFRTRSDEVHNISAANIFEPWRGEVRARRALCGRRPCLFVFHRAGEGVED